jgi:excisionase family DNA binding protein
MDVLGTIRALMRDYKRVDILRRVRKHHRLRAIDTPIIDIGQHAGPYITAAVLAEWLDINAQTVRKLIQRGKLAGFKAGREWRIPTADAQRFCQLAKD